MIEINQVLSKELNIKLWQVENSLKLKEEGGTIPFIARYRKERTGELDENVLSDLFDRHEYLTDLEDRKQTILKTIEDQGKLTEELKVKIENCLLKNELEDLYLPYKPKKRTRATIAREKGLEPLADFIRSHNIPNAPESDLIAEAGKYVDAVKGVNTTDEALNGASDILAEEFSEIAELRAWLRDFILREGKFVSVIKEDFPVGTTKYEMYRTYEAPLINIPAHAMLALRRGENEDIIKLDVNFDEDRVLNFFYLKSTLSSRENIKAFYASLIIDAFSRLMKLSIISEVRQIKKQQADEESIRVFESNLRQLLLSSPAGMKTTIGIDPGFRTGCKVSVLDSTGKFLEYHTIFPFQSLSQKNEAEEIIKSLIINYKVELLAIGNGTAGRETEDFVSELFKKMEAHQIKVPAKVMVNESGASIYSASKVANEEFPELDLTVRGAISIGRRLQDPLAELVKIDPKSIGVGQYQHDVDQKLLNKKLQDTVMSCVNYVGVDLNTSSKELLSYVSGINESTAKKIVEWRNTNGAFKNRNELIKVSKFGPKTFEQSAGFLRIRNSDNPLDNTAVHPESYYIVELIAKDAGKSVKDIVRMPELLDKIDLNKYVNDKVGIPTLTDIMDELKKPGRDPREVFKYASFSDGIKEIADLRQGMELEGVVTNITNFGAFVDIGVHQDGLVHISEMADRFIKNPAEVVKVGQIVMVTVKEVDVKLKRINLSMKKQKNKQLIKMVDDFKKEKKTTIDDLKKKFEKK